MDYNNDSYEYVIVDEQAYTKEKVLIYTIIATTSDEEITLEDILKYFESFGKVSNAYKIQAYAFSIQFADPKVTAKVLQQKEHKISNHIIDVDNDSCWNQPTIKGFVKYVQEGDEFEKNTLTQLNDDNDGAFILKLNDFCLESICCELSLQDQINFALTCQRFCDIFEMISRVKYINLDIRKGFKEFNSFQIIIFGLIVGPYVESMHYDFESLKVAKLLRIYCTNVKTLRIYSVPMTSFILGTHSENMPMLKTLELVEVELTDRMLYNIPEMKNLKFLSLISNPISGVTLSSLVNLKGLSLRRCRSILTNHFKDIFQNLKNLQYLDIRNCHNLGPEEYQCILENLKELKILKFTITKNNYSSLARLAKLQNLEIDSFLNSQLNEQFLKDLLKYQSQQMDNLKLYAIFNITYDKISIIADLKNLKVFWCCHSEIDNKCLEKLSELKELEDVKLLGSEDISDDGVMHLLKNCLQLKELHLVHCEQVTSELIRKAFILLQDQHEKWLRTGCLHLTVEDEKPFRDVKRELGLNESNPILKISFESSRDGSVYCSPPFPEGLDMLDNDDDEYEGDVNDDVIDDVEVDVSKDDNEHNGDDSN